VSFPDQSERVGVSAQLSGDDTGLGEVLRGALQATEL
jgi:hypothetical protein